MMSYCRNCGAYVPDWAENCPACDTPVKQTAQPKKEKKPPKTAKTASAGAQARREEPKYERRETAHRDGGTYTYDGSRRDKYAESYDADIWNRYQHNEFFSADSIHFADSLKRTTPGGKVVYGGGGIMPDVFVPADTTDVTKYFVEVAGRNILYRYTIEYADRHREALNAVKTIPELQALLDGDRGLVEDFIRYAARQGVAPNYRDIARSRKLIEAQLRAYIGRNTALEDNGFYANIYPVDNVIVRAVGILNETREND